MTVALVLVSHVAEIADGVRRLAAQMAPDVPILPVGGEDDGGVGTSFDRVLAALGETTGHGDGTVLLYDLGSALLTAETAVEALAADDVRIVDAPLVEGAIAAATAAQQGESLERVAEAARRQAAGGAGEPGENASAEAASAPGANALRADVALRNPLGLHARPAADLARMLTGADATVLLAGDDDAWVDARSVVAVIGLGLRGGDRVHLAAEGPEAEDSLARVVALVEEGFGEASVADAGEAAVTVLDGVAASPGVAHGPAALVAATTSPGGEGGSTTIDVEAQRLAAAIEAAGDQLAAADKVFAPIAAAHRTLLDDPMLRGRAADLVGKGKGATRAWTVAVDEAHALLSAVPDAQMADRAADVLDVGARVLAALLGEQFDAGLPEPAVLPGAVLVADVLLPSQVVAGHAAGARALVAARGGETAHAVQLARALGLPAVVGAGDGVRAIAAGRPLRVDGDRGTVQVE